MTTTDNLEFVKLETLDKLQKLEAAILSQDPELPNHLKTIHKNLIQYEELVHLLTDDQITTLMRGQKIHVGVQLVKESSKKAVSKSLKGISVDDL